MTPNSKAPRALLGAALLGAALATITPAGAETGAPRAAQTMLPTYDRLLPLEGGSNFRDMGGYFTEDGRVVRHGLLYRSGVMTGLSERDMQYLEGFGFRQVVDLRSREELELYPNHWVDRADIAYSHADYSMARIVDSMVDENGEPLPMSALYGHMPTLLKPQLRDYFQALTQGEAPIVVNCSAGQDRTGIASALLLTVLGVPREVIVQDYLISTRYRRPAIERGSVDLRAAAEENLFAQLMLRYSEDGEPAAAQPLLTDEGVPYLYYAFARIEADYGSVEAFLEQEIGVDAQAREQLRDLYLLTP
jgi:protein-tyrosine phosphatase